MERILLKEKMTVVMLKLTIMYGRVTIMIETINYDDLEGIQCIPIACGVMKDYQEGQETFNMLSELLDEQDNFFTHSEIEDYINSLPQFQIIL